VRATTDCCLAFAVLDSSLDLSGVCWWRCYTSMFKTMFKTGAASWHETLVNFHEATRHHDQEDTGSNLHNHRSVTSYHTF